jgi:hypothetical protein
LNKQALALTARSPAPSWRLRKAKASRPAVTGLLAKDKVSLPVASFVTLSGRDGTNQFECLSRSSRRPSSPAEQATTADAAKIGSLPLKENYECAQVRTCFVGAAWWPTARCAVTACAGSALPLTEKSLRKTRGRKTGFRSRRKRDMNSRANQSTSSANENERWHRFSTDEPRESSAYNHTEHPAACPPRTVFPVNRAWLWSCSLSPRQFAFGQGCDHSSYVNRMSEVIPLHCQI